MWPEEAPDPGAAERRTPSAPLRGRRGKLNDLILVTGGAGFIGSHLVEALLRRGSRVRVLDDLSSGRMENLAAVRDDPRVEVTIGSVRDRALVRSRLDGCGGVFHLAASVGVGMVMADPAECLRNNAEGVQVLVEEACRVSPMPRIVLFSSSEVYGKSEQIPLREDGDLVLGPTSIGRWSYASGKVMGEFLALAEHVRVELPVTVVRCFNTCGPRQRARYGMVVPRFIDQATAGEPITVFGDGHQTRCFSFVGDVVGGVVALFERSDTAGEVFNIGTDRETSILELARAVLKVTGSGSEIRTVAYDTAYSNGFQDVRRRVPDLSKIRARIGYQAATDLETLLRVTWMHRRALQAGGVETKAEAGDSQGSVRPSIAPAPGTSPERARDARISG